MYLTSDHVIGGKSISGNPEDFAFIVRYAWESSKHLKEAIKIMLSARLDGEGSPPRLEGEVTALQLDVQMRLASNPHTSEEVLDFLRKIGDRRVCQRVAANPRCPENAMKALLNHPAAEIRAELADNPHCPIMVLYRLATDSSPDVRYRLAENPRLPISILEELSEDDNPFVAARAQQTRRKMTQLNVLEGDFGAYLPAQSLVMLATS